MGQRIMGRQPSTPRRPPSPRPSGEYGATPAVVARDDSVVRAQHRRPNPIKPTDNSAAGSTAWRESRFRAASPVPPAKIRPGRKLRTVSRIRLPTRPRTRPA